MGILLVLLAAAMLCVSVSQYISFVWTQDSVKAQDTTIALPTNKYKISDDGSTVSVSSVQPREIQELLSRLPEQLPKAILSAEYHGQITAYCSTMNPLNWAECYTESAYTKNSDGTTSITNYPYTCAMIAFKATDISDTYRYGILEAPLETNTNESDVPELPMPDQGVAVDIVGTVETAYLLHEGFDDPTGYAIRLTVRCETEDMLAELDLREGERYLAYGMDYTDLNWLFRQRIGRLGTGAYKRFSKDNIRMLTQEEIDSLRENDPAEMEKYGQAEKFIAVYQEPGSEDVKYLKQSELDQIESCSLSVVCSPCVFAYSIDGEIKQFDMETGSFYTITNDEFNSMYTRAGIARLDGSVEALLEHEENTLWRETANALQINNHAFRVIATDNLASIAPFALQEALLADGRAFSKSEYDRGSAVCLISETLAVRSGLHVGDRIIIRFYETDEYYPGAFLSFKSANPDAAYFSTHQGFSSEETAYEIVGLYRQKQEWSDGAYAFTPNTVFVPKASVVGQTATNDSGIFYSLLLKNGAIEKAEKYLAEKGYAGLLSYYDQGYSDISDNLSHFFSISVKLLLVGIIGWCGFLAVFLFMFSAQQKSEAVRLWTLGAPKALVVRNYLAGGIGIALPGTILGGALSFLIMRNVFQGLSEQTGFTLDAAQTPLLIAVLLVVQLTVIVGLILLVAGTTVRRLYK